MSLRSQHSGEQPHPLGALHRLGAVAGPELAIQRAGVLLDRVRREVERAAAISRLVEPAAISSSTSRSRSDSSGAGCSEVGREHRHPEPDHPHRARHLARVPVLGDEPRGAGGARRRRRHPARRPEMSSTRVAGEAGGSSRTRRRRTRRPGTGRRARRRAAELGSSSQRLGAGPRRQAALHPRLLAEQHPEAPVHDVVVVDDQHPQLALGDRRSRRWGAAAAAADAGRPAAPASRLGSGAPNSTTPPCWSASNAARRRPIPAPRAPEPTPSLRTSSVNVSSSPDRRTTSTGERRRAWRRCAAPRRAPTGPAARRRPGTVHPVGPVDRDLRPAAACSAPRQLGGQRRAGVGGHRGQRPLERAAQVAERLLHLRPGSARARSASSGARR